MKLSEFKKYLAETEELNFILPDGSYIPKHFHITEVGVAERHFIDCGGTVRREKAVNLQLWYSGDVQHRLKPSKLLDIIALSEKVLNIETDADVEAEYQQTTIGRFELGFNAGNFLLLPKHTACLAEENCGVKPKQKLKLSELSATGACCTPESGCC